MVKEKESRDVRIICARNKADNDAQTSLYRVICLYVAMSVKRALP